MRIDSKTPIWLVTDPGPHSTLPDICFETTIEMLARQFAGGLSVHENPTLYTDADDAKEDAVNRLVVWRIARQIRIDRGASPDETIRVTLHGEDGRVIWKGDVR